MRKYIDFWVRAESFENALSLLEKLRELGFSSAVMELDGEASERFDELRKRGEEIGVEVYRKLVFKPSGRKDLLKNLRNNRGKYEVITVFCESLEAALVAARDSRVDSLVIPPKPGFRFDKGVAALLRNYVELPFSSYLENKLEFLETAIRILEFLGRRTGIIVSSAASDILDLRGPRELASILQVLGLPQEEALDSVSKIPESIINRNLLKLSKNYVERGVLKIG